MISIILIEPEKSGNVGAVARAMKNFGLSNLVLINPKCKPKSKEARNRAKHAQEVLMNAKIKGFGFLKKLDYLVATTAQLGTDYNIPRSAITADTLAEKLNEIDSDGLEIGILIGRESIGLTNKEILQ